jgi:hypothetical protein
MYGTENEKLLEQEAFFPKQAYNLAVEFRAAPKKLVGKRL